MSDWRIDVDDRDAERRLRQLSLFLSDLRPFWPVVTRLVRGWWSRQFETRGAFGGRPWAPLSPAYREWKEKHYPGKPILVQTGALRRAASSPQRFVTPRTLTLVINDEKLEHHQEGGPNLPARPLVFGSPLPFQAEAELDEAATEYVTDLLRRL